MNHSPFFHLKFYIMNLRNKRKLLFGCLVFIAGQIALAFAGSSQVHAQSGLTAQIGFGTDVPTYTNYLPAYRFSNTSANTSNRVYAIYEESELIAAGITPGMTINSMGFEKANGGTVSGSDLRIEIWFRTGNTQPPLGNTTWTAATSGATQVFNDPNVTFDDTTTWVPFNFQTGFIYTGGTLEIAVENEVGGSSPYGTDGWEWIYDNSFGTDHVVGSVGSTFGTSLTSSTQYSYRPNTQFGYLPPAGTDAALAGFTKPGANCAGSTDVAVALQNSGGDSILTATIDWTIDGTPQTPVTWTGQINTGDSVHVNLGSFTTTANTNYNLEAFITSVSPGNDTNAVNDTASVSYTPALNGIYTIDAGQAAGGTNYETFSSAASDLNNFGVCGPVTFNVASGSYNEQIIIEDVPGTSSTNTVTFQGADPATTILNFEQNQSDDRYTLRFDGASHITFDSLTIEAEDNGTYGWAVHILPNSSDLTLSNCSIVSPLGTSTFFNGVVASNSNTSYTSGGSNISNLKFEENTFVGGYNNMRLNGVTANKLSGVEILNNEFLEAHYSGVYILQGEDVEIDNNHMVGKTSGNTTGGGVWFS